MPALGACDRCGDFLCLRCLSDRDGGLYCPSCVSSLPRLATPGSRVAAHLIDIALVGLGSLLGSALLLAILAEGGVSAAPYEWAISGFAAFAVPIGGVQLALVHQNGQSVGKRIMKVRVVTLDGQLPGVWRVLILRNVAPWVLGVVPLIGVIFRIANIAALFSDGNRALHDRFAGTKVMKVEERT